jgi:hypothetical protein
MAVHSTRRAAQLAVHPAAASALSAWLAVWLHNFKHKYFYVHVDLVDGQIVKMTKSI